MAFVLSLFVSHLSKTIKMSILFCSKRELSSVFGKEPIAKTRLYNVDPLKQHFDIVKLWLTGVNIFFLFSAQNIDCGYSLEPPRRGGSNE